MKRLKQAVLGVVVFSLSALSYADIPVTITPQGEIKDPLNVKVQFAKPVINIGHIDTVSPFTVDCQGTDIKGQGRWIDTSFWQYDFARKLPAGVVCQVNINSTFKDTEGNTLADTQNIRFHTGAPSLTSIYPYAGDKIDEDQVFVLSFDTPIKPSSLAEKTVCLIEGIGEQVPIRVIDEQVREKLSKQIPWIGKSSKEQYVQCSRNFPNHAKVSLVINPGLKSQSGIPTHTPFTKNFTARGPFSVKFICERSHFKEACSPLGDVTLSFSAYLKKEDAQKIQFLVDGKLQTAQPLEGNVVNSVVYKGPFAPNSKAEIIFPKQLQDDYGRSLSNAQPLHREFSSYPSLLKFATGDFGIIERYAHTGGGKKTPALIPLTVRNVENNIALKRSPMAAKVKQLSSTDDSLVRYFLKTLPLLNDARLSEANIHAVLRGERIDYFDESPSLDTRNISLLDGVKGTVNVAVPTLKGDHNQTEVVGIPIQKPGFYVLEANSLLLGKALTEREKPMYVRTAVLVTNMAVHLKVGKSNAAVWVTRLDDAAVIPNADVRISDCRGHQLAKGKTNKEGIFIYHGNMPSLENCTQGDGYMASATLSSGHPMAKGENDYSFVISNWNDGIEPWRFNLGSEAYSWNRNDSPLILHTVLGRTLLRAGETIHMKHYVREKTAKGLRNPNAKLSLPSQLSIQLAALDQEIKLPLEWKTASSGSRYAETTWVVPKSAKNGLYQIDYINGEEYLPGEASFRVEEFKLPMLKGSITLSSQHQESSVLINPNKIKANIQINYMSGGGAAQLPIQVSAMYIPTVFSFDDYADASFESIGNTDHYERKLFLDKKAATLDINGNVNMSIDDIPAIQGKGDIVVEVSFMDPNGQVQTITQRAVVSSSTVLAGIRSSGYFEPNTDFPFDVMTVNPLGKPQANQSVKVDAKRLSYHVIRKRLVGGFYSIDYHTDTEELGTVCEGVTDNYGRLKCTANIAYEGELVLSASVVDKNANSFASKSSLWVYKGASWYSGNDTDRVDVVADKKQYRVGEEAIFDVRIPFKEATALISIERDNVIDYQVVSFKENSSTFALTVKENWSPNVYVSVLSVRGRIRTGVNDEGRAWAKDDTQAEGASALIDLAKPSFRFGVTGIKVVDPKQQVALALSLNKPSYQVREKVKLSISGQLGNGEKAAKANVAVFVVDKALLELAKNNTTRLYDAMFSTRSWEVVTSTAQGEVVGRRHYGRKAVPAGGGGGLAPTRELFDTMVFWKSNVELDEQGQAEVEFTLNDSITEFEVVAVADDNEDAFGTKTIHLTSQQDLQVISGLPNVIRDTDNFRAVVTVRNASRKNMQVVVQGKASKFGREFIQLPAQTVSVDAGHAHQVFWEIEPISLDESESGQTITWMFDAKEKAELGTNIHRDRIQVKQTLLSYVPITVRQSQLLNIKAGSKAVTLPVQSPTQALSKNHKIRGGIQVKLQENLSTSLDGVTHFFENYPYTCFEQFSSIAVGLNSDTRWDRLMQILPSYMDRFGFVSYFPGSRQGSPLLTAYLLSISSEARALGRDFTIPDHLQAKMLEGLSLLVQGKLHHNSDWTPIYRDPQYYLRVMAALSRYNAVTSGMIEKYPLGQHYTVSSLIDLYIIHRHLKGANQAANLSSLRTAILAKMERQADRLVFAGAYDNMWWLMDNISTLQAKLLLAVVDDDAWQQEIPYLVQGLVALQERGQWGTTTGNVWGTLAITAFSNAFEKIPSEGAVYMAITGGGYAKPEEWNGLRLNQKVLAPWLDKQPAQLSLSLEGQGSVWATVSSLAAVNPIENTFAGYRIEKIIEPITNRKIGQWSVGDVYRVKLRVIAGSPMTWVVINDPIPSGATILGSGLGRDSAIENDRGEQNGYNEPTFIERKSDVFRAYYQFMDRGEVSLTYTVRLNNLGKFSIPATRVHGMYSPSTFGEFVNTDIQVKEP